jgi:muramoyltetrapeptide carboxypeptidase
MESCLSAFPKHSGSNCKLETCVIWSQLTYQIPADEMNRIGTATGELVGGNLSILYSLLDRHRLLTAKIKFCL